MPTKYVYPIPDDMSFSDAAAVAINFVVAHILLFDLAAIRPGKSLLLHSAGGGVVSARYRQCLFRSVPRIGIKRKRSCQSIIKEAMKSPF